MRCARDHAIAWIFAQLVGPRQAATSRARASHTHTGTTYAEKRAGPPVGTIKSKSAPRAARVNKTRDTCAARTLRILRKRAATVEHVSQRSRTPPCAALPAAITPGHRIGREAPNTIRRARGNLTRAVLHMCGTRARNTLTLAHQRCAPRTARCKRRAAQLQHNCDTIATHLRHNYDTINAALASHCVAHASHLRRTILAPRGPRDARRYRCGHEAFCGARYGWIDNSGSRSHIEIDQPTEAKT